MTMQGHVPVMLAEVLATLGPQDGATYLDATFGGGGYARAILEAAPGCTVFAIDRDPDAIARGAALAQRFAGRLHLVEGRFGDMLSLLRDRGITALDGVVMDLGVSSFQLDQAERGFSFRADGPLDMRMEKSGPSAAELVNGLPERELAEVERGIAAAMELLAPGGRLVVVAFHSLEDRIVKQAMAAASGRGGASRHDPAALSGRAKPAFHLLTPRAMRPQDSECSANPRARSARLRGIERLGLEHAA